VATLHGVGCDPPSSAPARLAVAADRGDESRCCASSPALGADDGGCRRASWVSRLSQPAKSRARQRGSVVAVDYKAFPIMRANDARQRARHQTERESRLAENGARRLRGPSTSEDCPARAREDGDEEELPDETGRKTRERRLRDRHIPLAREPGRQRRARRVRRAPPIGRGRPDREDRPPPVLRNLHL
jgi:hypothetical protein